MSWISARSNLLILRCEDALYQVVLRRHVRRTTASLRSAICARSARPFAGAQLDKCEPRMRCWFTLRHGSVAFATMPSFWSHFWSNFFPQQ